MINSVMKDSAKLLDVHPVISAASQSDRSPHSPHSPSRKAIATSLSLAVALSLTVTGCGLSSTSKPESTAEATPESTQKSDSASTSASASPETSTKSDAKSNVKPGAKPEAKGGDRQLLIGQWTPIAYIQPDGKTNDLSGIPDEERTALTWEFRDDGSVKAGDSLGKFTIDGVTFAATNEKTGETTNFGFTVTQSELFVIKPSGDALQLKRAEPQ